MLPYSAVTRWLATLFALAAGCGRYEFDRATAIDAAEPDAGPDASLVPASIHRYALAGGYRDELGGAELTGLGGAFDAGGGYRFGLNQGLRATNVVPLAPYTIDVTFAFDKVVTGMYQKIIDFKELGNDEGLYVWGETLDFVVDAPTKTEAVSRALFSAGTIAKVTLTRDGAGAVVGYVNRASAIAFADPGLVAEFTHQGRVANFVIDDNPTSQGEAGAGIVRAVEVWDVALTAAQVAALR